MNDATALNMAINQGNSFNISAIIIDLNANTRMKTTAFKVITNLEFANRVNKLCHTAF